LHRSFFDSNFSPKVKLSLEVCPVILYVLGRWDFLFSVFPFSLIYIGTQAPLGWSALDFFFASQTSPLLGFGAPGLPDSQGGVFSPGLISTGGAIAFGTRVLFAGSRARPPFDAR